MKISIHFRSLIACIALFSMLFMQLAVASYNCPMTMTGSDNMSAQNSVQMTMSDCAGMDSEMPTLCHVHAYGDVAKQSLDKSELPTVSPFLLAGFVLVLQPIHQDQATFESHDVPLDLTRITSPPTTIRHCCFRI